MWSIRGGTIRSAGDSQGASSWAEGGKTAACAGHGGVVQCYDAWLERSTNGEASADRRLAHTDVLMHGCWQNARARLHTGQLEGRGLGSAVQRWRASVAWA